MNAEKTTRLAGEIRLALVERHLWTETSSTGKEAITAYRVVETLARSALVELEPKTGRSAARDSRSRVPCPPTSPARSSVVDGP